MWHHCVLGRRGGIGGSSVGRAVVEVASCGRAISHPICDGIHRACGTNDRKATNLLDWGSGCVLSGRNPCHGFVAILQFPRIEGIRNRRSVHSDLGGYCRKHRAAPRRLLVHCSYQRDRRRDHSGALLLASDDTAKVSTSCAVQTVTYPLVNLFRHVRRLSALPRPVLLAPADAPPRSGARSLAVGASPRSASAIQPRQPRSGDGVTCE